MRRSRAPRGYAAGAVNERPATPGSDLRQPLALALATILGSYALAWLGYAVLSDRLPESVLGIWNRWDAVHYLDIARDGYSADPERRFLIVWLPLYPWLTRAPALLVGDVHLAALLVSGASYAAALVLLHRLALLDYSAQVAERATLYLAIFPTAYFLHAAYTEALFLALVLGSFYAARCGRWAWAGALGGLASFTRITAFGLIPALLVEYLLQNGWRRRKLDSDVLWLGLIPVGFGLYMLVTWVELGDPLAFLEVARERHFKTLAPPWVGVERVWAAAQGAGPRWMLIMTVYEIGLGLAALALALAGILRLRASYSVFWLVAWANFGFNSWWISTARYLLVLFPAFLLLALWSERRWLHWSLCTFFGSSYVLLMLLYVQGHWTF